MRRSQAGFGRANRLVIRTLTIERLQGVRRLLPTDVYLWAKALLLALVAVQAARLIWVLLTPVGPIGAWQPAPPRLVSAEERSLLFATLDPFHRAGPGTATATAAPSLDLQLFGVRMSSGAMPASAILGPADGEQKSYLVGEEVESGVTLASVGFDFIILKRGEAEQRIYMEGAEAGASETAPAGSAAGGGSVASAIDIRPRMQGDRVTGVTVAPGANAALFASAGFQPGDVVVAVNGARITSMIDVQQLQSSIAPGARLLLTVERGAASVPIALNIPGAS